MGTSGPSPPGSSCSASATDSQWDSRRRARPQGGEGGRDAPAAGKTVRAVRRHAQPPHPDSRLLAHIADRLAIPPHLLGLSSDDADDFAAMVQFAESTLRLAEVARQSGRAVDAARELGPLVARLESRVAEGRADRDALLLLAHGRLALGTALVHILPEERLAVAARWTGRAWSLASRLDDAALQGHMLRMHGNELRKARHVPAAIARLSQAAAMTDEVSLRGATLALLARAAAEHGDMGMFDTAIGEASRLLEVTDQFTMLLNPFSIREIR